MTHQAETLLDGFRNKGIAMDSYYVCVEIGVLDCLRKMLDQVATTNSDNGMEEARMSALGALDEALKRLEASGNHDVPPGTEDAKNRAPLAKNPPSSPEAERMPAIDGDGIPEFAITPEVAARFAQESQELLDNTEQNLLSLAGKSGEERTTVLNEIFRLIHSFKGNCGFMQIADMERLSHKLENVLDAMRSGDIQATEQNLDIMLQVLDILRSGLASYSRGEGGVIYNCDIMLEFLGDIMPKATETTEPSNQAAQTGQTTQTSQKALVRKDIRVDLEKLDRLVNLVGELVVAEAMVLRNPALKQLEDENLDRAVHHLSRISAELQDMAMSVRMIPLAATFKKMIRLVHDLSVKSGKKVNVELVGEETEVDKNVIEQISDPLVHIIRNSIDHGLELGDERIRLGKPEKGTVVIESKHDGGEVVICVSDDGRGLDRDKILKKALEKDLVKGDPSQLSDKEIHALIFEPGFSTAETLTDISGRGVGMDVVKRNIEKLNGRVEIKTIPRQGTDIVIHIPLTLAIIDGMLVSVGDSHYAIPLLSVRESIRPEARMVTTTPDGREVVRIRDELIPVVRLHHIYEKTGAVTELDKGILVIVDSEIGSAALLFDEIIGQHQVVIKGLSPYLGTPKGISGCAILGNGHVSLILDVNTLLKSIGGESRSQNLLGCSPAIDA